MHQTFKVVSVVIYLVSTAVHAETYTVQHGDSLWKIAAKTKSSDVTVHQMIAAIHEENSALLGTDISNIRPGMELVIPTFEVALNANSSVATQLLANTGRQVSARTRNDRIDDIHKQISRIEQQIQDTMETMQASKAQFSKVLQ